jgi:hypothetical protein
MIDRDPKNFHHVYQWRVAYYSPCIGPVEVALIDVGNLRTNVTVKTGWFEATNEAVNAFMDAVDRFEDGRDRSNLSCLPEMKWVPTELLEMFDLPERWNQLPIQGPVVLDLE